MKLAYRFLPRSRTRRNSGSSTLSFDEANLKSTPQQNIPANMGDAEIKTSSWRLVELGRVILFNTGPHDGRLATIVEIIDHKRVCYHRARHLALELAILMYDFLC